MKDKYIWQPQLRERVQGIHYTCGYCGREPAPSQAYFSNEYHQDQFNKTIADINGWIYICSKCGKPTFFDFEENQTPAIKFGNEVESITAESVKKAYTEARDCTGVGAYTAAVLICRKILMNLAHTHGAAEGLRFVQYVDFLHENHYTPPNSDSWVDKIRTKGNEATHEIPDINKEDAKQILRFVEMLQKFNFEFNDPVENENSSE